MVKRYLSLVSLEEALDTLSTAFPPVRVIEDVPVEDSAGRVTAEPVFTRFSVPEVHLSAMDGIAVRSADTAGASEYNPVTLESVKRVNTGNVVPPEFDAVVMIEDVWEENGRYTIQKAVPPWQHVRPAGEDIAESEMVIPSMHLIRPHEVGPLATYGITQVPVITLRAGLIPTGSELVPPGIRPGPGQVVESNTMMAAAWLRAFGATCTRYPLTPDEPDLIRQAIVTAVRENDLVIVSAGSSAGTRDYTADVIGELGEVFIHGVAIKPGKPVIIGKINEKPVIGMPGYPLGALTVIRELLLPLLSRCGLFVPEPGSVPARLTSTLHSDVGTDEFVLLSLGKIGDRFVATPQSRGSGIQMSAVRANGYLRIPSSVEGYEAGGEVPVTLMVPRSGVESSVLVTGSHDPVLDYLSELAQRGGVEIHSTHVGSMGGVLALKRGDCHAAPMHLLSPDGDYNREYLEKYLPGEDISLLCIAEREQGIASREGYSLSDLPDIRFINRQKGSGTRILLDYELGRAGISPDLVQGYDREVTTHLAVALAVKSGEADAGMCVYSAARALGLVFVPVARERYELAIPQEILSDPRIGVIVDAVRSEEFRSVLERLGGYDSTETGVLRRVP